jgi:hypothetical protein
MHFPIPLTGGRTCATAWEPPAECSVKIQNVTTKRDITEIGI